MACACAQCTGSSHHTSTQAAPPPTAKKLPHLVFCAPVDLQPQPCLDTVERAFVLLVALQPSHFSAGCKHHLHSPRPAHPLFTGLQRLAGVPLNTAVPRHGDFLKVAQDMGTFVPPALRQSVYTHHDYIVALHTILEEQAPQYTHAVCAFLSAAFPCVLLLLVAVCCRLLVQSRSQGGLVQLLAAGNPAAVPGRASPDMPEEEVVQCFGEFGGSVQPVLAHRGYTFDQLRTEYDSMHYMHADAAAPLHLLGTGDEDLSHTLVHTIVGAAALGLVCAVYFDAFASSLELVCTYLVCTNSH